MKFFNLKRLTILFDGFNNFINLGFNLLLIAMLANTNSMMVVITFANNNDAWREFGNKCDVGTVASIVIFTDEAFGNIVNTCNTASFREVTNKGAFNIVNGR